MARIANCSAEEDGLHELDKPNARVVYQRMSSVLMLPREHGAWAMLLMPFLLGTIVAGRVEWTSLLLLVSILCLFTASRPLELALQGRSGAWSRFVAYGVAGVMAGSTLLLAYGRWILVPIGVLAGIVLSSLVVLRRHRLDRTWPARISSIASLSATGPAAYYAATGVLDERAFAVWVLCLVQSAASVFYVRLFYHAPDRKKGTSLDGARRRAEQQMLAYVGTAFVVVAGLALMGFVPPLGLVALIPLGVKAIRGCLRRDSRPTLRQIGFAEMGHSALFLVLASAAIYLW